VAVPGIGLPLILCGFTCVFLELRGAANLRCLLSYSRLQSETTLAPVGESKEVEYFFASDPR